MAKTKVVAQSMVLTMSLGADKNGKAVYKNLTLKNLKPTVLDESVQTVADAVAAVLPFEVTNLSRNTTTDIFKDAPGA